jgi:hypothetical protein
MCSNCSRGFIFFLLRYTESSLFRLYPIVSKIFANFGVSFGYIIETIKHEDAEV